MHRIPATKAGKRLNIFSLFPSSTTTIQHRTYCPTPLEPLKPVAVQLWEQEQAKKLGLPPPQSSYVEKDELFDDPLYSPIPKVNTGNETCALLFGAFFYIPTSCLALMMDSIRFNTKS